MIIKRDITSHLLQLSQQFPVVAITGPRQSGKTTLACQTFSDYAYITLEDLDQRLLATRDPRTFFATYEKASGLIIDEIQEAPELLSYMQGIVDKEYRPGFFIVTGSHQLLLHEKVAQTLAGRVAFLTLLPLTVEELKQAGKLEQGIEALMIKGFYPRLYVQPISVKTWFSNYISTYVERDVRNIINITDLVLFQRFLKLCAARVGNLLNYADLARDCDISPHTAKAWASLLEASYIIKLVTPYYKNYSKRVIKSPKLYFYDTALVCSLLGIETAEELFIHPIRGALFESFVMSELFKYSYNANITPQIYFWRDVQGHEVDCLIERSFTTVIPVEIKARRTITADFFKGLLEFILLSQIEMSGYIIYSGDQDLMTKDGQIVSWQSIAALFQKLYERTN